jgi:hypothetical protein
MLANISCAIPLRVELKDTTPVVTIITKEKEEEEEEIILTEQEQIFRTFSETKIIIMAYERLLLWLMSGSLKILLT